VLIAWSGCSAALADADPASDVLLGENVFYPYNPPVASSLQRALNAETAAAHRGRFPVKVALIATPVDLGAIPTFFGKPRQYAAYLDQEISFGQAKVPLLVVMPDGYGTAGLSPAAAAAAASLPRPTSAAGSSLAQAALAAVRKLTAASGHRLGGGSTGSSGSSPALPLAIVAIVCVLLAGGIVTWRHRRSPARRRRGI
jgi:hypothetical protein